MDGRAAPAGLAGSARRWQSGQAIIEFILIFPLLLLIAAAIWEYGRVFDAQLVATNAAREGARYAASNTDTQYNGTSLTAETIDRVEAYLVAGYGPRLKSFMGATSYNGKPFNPSGDVTVQSVTVCYFNDPVSPTTCLATQAPGERVQVTVQAQVRVFIPLVPGLTDPHQFSAIENMVLQ